MTAEADTAPNLASRLKNFSEELIKSKRKGRCDTEVKLVTQRTSSLKLPAVRTSLTANPNSSSDVSSEPRRNSTNTVHIEDLTGEVKPSCLPKPSVITTYQSRGSTRYSTGVFTSSNTSNLFSNPSSLFSNSSNLISNSSNLVPSSSSLHPEKTHSGACINPAFELDESLPSHSKGMHLGAGVYGEGIRRAHPAGGGGGLGAFQLMCSCWRSATNCLKTSLQGKCMCWVTSILK